jgi:hypothetical protein
MAFTSPGTYYSESVTGYLATIAFSAYPIPSPVTYDAAIIEIRTIKSNNFTVPDIDVTTLQSPNSTEEYIPGLIKPGTIECTGNFIGDSTQQTIPVYAQGSGIGPQIIAYKIVANVQRGAKTYTQTADCFIMKWEVGPFENNKAVDVSFSAKITGTITESYA